LEPIQNGTFGADVREVKEAPRGALDSAIRSLAPSQWPSLAVGVSMGLPRLERWSRVRAAEIFS
jgi:hypothetical protein